MFVLQRSHANALPDLPSLASMAIVELRGLGDTEESLFAEEGIMGSCMCGEIPIICQDLGPRWGRLDAGAGCDLCWTCQMLVARYGAHTLKKSRVKPQNVELRFTLREGAAPNIHQMPLSNTGMGGYPRYRS